MKKIKYLLLISALLIPAGFASGQKKAPPKAVFAVLNDGKTLEPIAFIEDKKLKGIAEESGESEGKTDLVKTFYKPKAKYNLIFGGKTAGTATIVKDLADTECASNQAEISVLSSRVKPKGFLMALATNMVPKKTVKGIRQLPHWSERLEIEKLVMAEMKAKKVPIKNTGELRYHNLTKIDVDDDGKFEFVGTFWYNTGEKIRSLLFFIAEKDSAGKISIAFSNFDEIKEEDVMSGEIKTIDDGVYHELLLDMLDYDGDGTREIFTIKAGFEGSNFYAYKKENGQWTQVLETSNYHCGY
ncbi:MAG: hypothetical protein R2747_06750 [Pyrinomonadaceae bacterium]